jgi:hypothetical protein
MRLYACVRTEVVTIVKDFAIGKYSSALPSMMTTPPSDMSFLFPPDRHQIPKLRWHERPSTKRPSIDKALQQTQSVRLIRRSSAAVGQSCPPNRAAPPSFPCVDAHATREARLQQGFKDAITAIPSSSNSSSSGPEPPYARPSPKSCKIYHHSGPLELVYSGSLPSFDIAYETWGTLSPKKDNVILLHTGLSASSHAASTEANPSEGWWEKFIGPGKALDTNQFYIICTNVIGGCYGSTGPSSFRPATSHPDGTPQERERYATNFPVLSIFDMVRAQFKLLDGLGIDEIYASVGSSMGAMQSLAAGWLFPERVGKVVSISGTARSSPSAIAMRFAQRSGQSSCFSLVVG